MKRRTLFKLAAVSLLPKSPPEIPDEWEPIKRASPFPSYHDPPKLTQEQINEYVALTLKKFKRHKWIAPLP